MRKLAQLCAPDRDMSSTKSVMRVLTLVDVAGEMLKSRQSFDMVRLVTLTIVPGSRATLSRNLADNSSERNELHMESGGLFSDSL